MFSLYKKELHAFFFSPLAYIVTAIFLLIFSLTFVSGISDISGTDDFVFSFPNILYNNFFYFLFLIPVLTMKSFPDERKNNTEVLLISSPLNITKIVLSKFLSVATVFAAMLAVSLVYPIITMFIGQVVWSSLISGYIGFYLWGLVCIAIGIFISSFFESTILSVIFGEAAMLLLIYIDNLSLTAYFSNLNIVSSILTFFSTSNRFQIFAEGLFRLSDIVFYISSAVVFILLTIIVLERRRWSRG